MTIDDTKFEDSMRRVMHEVIQAEVPQMVRGIVREETADMRQDITDTKDLVGTHGMRLSHMQTQVGHLVDAVRYQAAETHRLDILLEDLNDRFATARELRWD